MIPIDQITGRMGNRMFQYAALYAHAQRIHVDPHFQDERYFTEFEPQIRALFGTGIGWDDRVAIHVRRGDYLVAPGNKYHLDLCETEYYERAIERFPDARFLVFCCNRGDGDAADAAWCRQRFTGPRFDFHEHEGSESDDMNAMASCQHQIIANSSFSWWAAWLNPKPRKIVVAPKQWTVSGDDITHCPKDWIRL